METLPKPVKLLVIIVEKAKNKKAIKVLNRFELSSQIAAIGTGTAVAGFYSLFGTCETCKSVIFSVIPQEQTAEIFKALEEELDFARPATGVAFTIPIKSVSSMRTLKYMLGEKEESSNE